MKKNVLIKCALVLISTVSTVDMYAIAGSLNDAIAAYEHHDYGKAMELFRPLAEQGNVNAQKIMAEMYYAGQGVDQDYAEALKWFQLAAAQGLASAQSRLGEMYYLGQGITKDNAEALKWFQLAAAQGNMVAQADLGAAYITGEGVSKDYAEAFKWLKLSATQGFPVAQKTLGLMYYRGQGVTRDDTEALKWFRLAAAQGDAAAQQYLDQLIKSSSSTAVGDSAKDQRSIAIQAMANKEYSIALPIFKRIVDQNPNSAEANWDYGGTLFASASTYFNGTDHKPIFSNEAMPILQEAIVYLDKAAKMFRSDNRKDQLLKSQAYYLEGDIYHFGFGDLDKAEKEYRMALKIYPEAQKAEVEKKLGEIKKKRAEMK